MCIRDSSRGIFGDIVGLVVQQAGHVEEPIYDLDVLIGHARTCLAVADWILQAPEVVQDGGGPVRNFGGLQQCIPGI